MPKNTALPKEVEDQLREYFWHKLQTFLRTAEKGKNTIVRGKYSNDWHIMGTTDDIIRWLQENHLTQAHQDTEQAVKGIEELQLDARNRCERHEKQTGYKDSYGQGYDVGFHDGVVAALLQLAPSEQRE